MTTPRPPSVMIFACKYVHGFACLQVHMGRSDDDIGVSHYPVPPYFGQGLSLNLEFISNRLTSESPGTVSISDSISMTGFYIGSGDVASGHHAYSASTLPAESCSKTQASLLLNLLMFGALKETDLIIVLAVLWIDFFLSCSRLREASTWLGWATRLMLPFRLGLHHFTDHSSLGFYVEATHRPVATQDMSPELASNNLLPPVRFWSLSVSSLSQQYTSVYGLTY